MAPVKEFPLPDVGEGLTEAEILTWHVAPGDTVTVNQVIVEIETAKAAVELPCPYAGVVTDLFAEPGATVLVGAPLIAIDTDPTTSAPATAGAGAAARVPNLVGYGPRPAVVSRRARKGDSAPPPVPNPPASIPQEPVPAAETAVDGTAVDGAAVDGTAVPLAKPPVRKLARELGIDLRTVAGTGTAGVITRQDVQRAAQPPARNGTVARAGGLRGQRREPIRGVRKATAAAMVASAFTAPHVTEFLTLDVTPMMELRAQLKGMPQFRDVKL
ncbi:MAG: biotin/lipoyl-containing protein, partial [Actinomycetes bacterium]